MLELKPIGVEVWTIAACPVEGIWKLGGIDPLVCGPVLASTSIHATVEETISQAGFDIRPPAKGGDLLWLHSTSWRDLFPDRPWMLTTYLAVIQPVAGAAPVFQWPDVLPITPALAGELGPPQTHGPTQRPSSREWDVLVHGVGHIKNQIKLNATTRKTLGALWRDRVAPFTETLAGQYEVEHPDDLAA